MIVSTNFKTITIVSLEPLIVAYYALDGYLYMADINSLCEIGYQTSYAFKNGNYLKELITGLEFKIDNHLVSQETYKEVKSILNKNYKGYLNVQTTHGKRADMVMVDEWSNIEDDEWLRKEDIEMPKIVSYNFYPAQGTTKIVWSDGSKTVVTAKDPESADKYTGFVSAIAKKAMGNKGGMLKAYHDLVEQPEIDLRKAEQKAKEDAIKAEETRKKAEQEEIESLARGMYENYKEYKAFDNKWSKAMEIANERYHVPVGYLEDLDDNKQEDFTFNLGIDIPISSIDDDEQEVGE